MSIFIGPHMTLEQLDAVRNQINAHLARQAGHVTYHNAQQARMTVQNVDGDYHDRQAAMDMVFIDGVWQLPPGR